MSRIVLPVWFQKNHFQSAAFPIVIIVKNILFSQFLPRDHFLGHTDPMTEASHDTAFARVPVPFFSESGDGCY